MNSLRLYLVGCFVHHLPETRAFGLKRSLYRWAGAKIGNNVRICSSVKIMGVGQLEIGENTWIGPETFISASSTIKIGANCDIAPRVFIGDGTHELTPDRGRVADIETCHPITIGDGCWICANATIISGVEIGKKCVVAAGAVVVRSFEEMSIIGGVPAKVIKRIGK